MLEFRQYRRARICQGSSVLKPSALAPPKRGFLLWSPNKARPPARLAHTAPGGLIALGVRRTGVRQLIYVAADGYRCVVRPPTRLPVPAEQPCDAYCREQRQSRRNGPLATKNCNREKKYKKICSTADTSPASISAQGAAFGDPLALHSCLSAPARPPLDW
jgi:hypothetical protein